MQDILHGLLQALTLATTFDRELVRIVLLSFEVSGVAVLIASALALPFGAWLALVRFPGRNTLIAVLNGMMGLPPVVIGLVVYLLLSRAGPLGPLGLLFTPGAMVVAQAILIFPIIAALARQVIEDAWSEYREQITSLNATRWQAMQALLWDMRFTLLTSVLAGFGRAIAEVGAVMIVGGNIDGVTRVMTTAIALETSKGDLPLALALGMVLIALVVIINAAAQFTKNLAMKKHG
ncbi:MAG: ABC transporter permease [Betaproteobacteria bacterium]|nr:ABC transporter permease [Betaproteobacteria bacterium]